MVSHTSNPSNPETEAEESPSKASLSYIVRPCLKKSKIQTKNQKQIAGLEAWVKW
jgi:hypothetical protein